MENRIGILGMSGNPPHRGHEMLITSLLRSGRFDKLIVVLTGRRKEADKLYVHPDHRVAMAELAFGRFRLHREFKTEFVIRYSDVYFENTPTYTLLNNFQEEFPGDIITFIVGSDLLYPQENLKGKGEIEAVWFKGKQLLKEFNILVVPRKDYSISEVLFQFNHLNEIIPNISSTTIRKCIEEEVRYLEHVSGDVAMYMYKHYLYQ